jgi:PAS domain S-box-containing protein
MTKGRTKSETKKLSLKASGKLTRLYIIALSAVAILTISGQILIQKSIKGQLADAHVINLSGSQRYLSQQICKISLLLLAEIDHKDFIDKTDRLKQLLVRWNKGHLGLQYGDEDLKLPGKNSVVVTQMFKELDGYYANVYESGNKIVALTNDGSEKYKSELGELVKVIMDNENDFFHRMDEIVHQYDREALEKVSSLQVIETVLLFITLLILLLEGLFVFRPAANKIRETIIELIKSEGIASSLAHRLTVLNGILERSLKDLKDVNFALDKSTILAKSDKYGIITYVNDQFCEISGYRRDELIGQRFGILSGHYHSKAFFDELWDTISSGKIWNHEIKNQSKDGSYFWLDAAIVPVMGKDNCPESYIAIYSDVTQRFRQSMIEQKIRSASLIEGQEKERRKTARELHDGLGQMLTALKFNIETIKGSSSKKEKERLGDIKNLLGETIQEVRRISFNLMPSVLSDFGIVSAFKHLCELISKYSGKKIVFVSNVDQVRLNKTIEINLYRILQEALNNAVKYAEADEVVVHLNINEGSNVELVISDNGKGFKNDKSSKKLTYSGNGITNIQERASMMNGDFRIETAIGQGTKISIFVPIIKEDKRILEIIK